jgi:hypothetical protein
VTGSSIVVIRTLVNSKASDTLSHRRDMLDSSHGIVGGLWFDCHPPYLIAWPILPTYSVRIRADREYAARL